MDFWIALAFIANAGWAMWMSLERRYYLAAFNGSVAALLLVALVSE